MESAQIQAFKRDGFVIIPRRQWLSEEQLESWRAQAWASLTLDRHDPGSWPLGSPELHVERNFGVYTEEAQQRIVYPWSGAAAQAADGRGARADPYPVRPAVGELPTVKAITDQLMSAGMYGHGMDPDFNGTGVRPAEPRCPFHTSCPASPP